MAESRRRREVSLIFEAGQGRGFLRGLLEFMQPSLLLDIPHNSLDITEFVRAKELMPMLGFVETSRILRWMDPWLKQLCKPTLSLVLVVLYISILASVRLDFARPLC